MLWRKMEPKPSHLGLLLAGLLFWSSAPAFALEEAWSAFTASRESAEERVDHRDWQGLLEKYVSSDSGGIHRVDYGGVSTADRRVLDDYLSRLTRVRVTALSRAEQLAYWINLYNALTVRVVLDHYPVASIRKIRPGWFALGPWKEKWIEIEGHPVSLDDIEHRILRPIWRDPRIHYAVNCAALGCPNLQRAAFDRENAEGLLEKAARAYVNHPRGVSFRGEELVVSSIYRWFREDFGDSEAGVLSHLRRYADPDLADRLAGVDEIADDVYDWKLNDRRP